MEIKILPFAILVMLVVCVYPLKAGPDTPFKRIPFSFKVPLGENAPAVVTDGKRLAYSDSRNIHIVKLPKGEKITSLDIPLDPQDRKGAQVHLIGIVNNNVFARVRYFDDKDRPDPAGSTAIISGGETGVYHFVKIDIEQNFTNIVQKIPYTAWFAERLYNNHMVYADRNRLCIVPLEQHGKQLEFPLKSKAAMRPKVTAGAVSVVCRKHLCVWRPESGRIEHIPYADTPLAPFGGKKYLGYAVVNETVFVPNGEEIAACDLRGKLKWRIPASGDLTPVAGDKGELCLAGNSTFCGVDPENGKITWRRKTGLVGSWYSRNEMESADIINGKLVVFQRKLFSVFDAETGDVLLNFYQDMDLKRGSYNLVTSVLHRMCHADTVAVIGYENSVFGVDLTPTKQVPPKHRHSDPANAAKDLESPVLGSTKSWKQAQFLKKIGANMMDTPELGRKVIPYLKKILKKSLMTREAKDLLGAYYWIDDPFILKSMLTYIADKRVEKYDRRRIARLLTGYPDTALLNKATKEIVSNPGSYEMFCREIAADYREQQGLNETPRNEKNMLKVLYSGNNEEIIETFRRMLKNKAEKDIRRTLELLEQAPDKVIIGLEKDLKKLSNPVFRSRGMNLVKKAEERLKKIKGTNDG